MQVKLIKTGGLLGKKMSSSREWEFLDQDWEELIQAVEKKEKASKRIPDATHYAIQKGNEEEIKIDIGAIPSRYQPFFKKMFDDLKVEKR